MSSDPTNQTPPSEDVANPSVPITAPTLAQDMLVPETLVPPTEAPGDGLRTQNQPRPPGGSSPPQEDIPAGLPTLPGYQLLRELGRGGMGVVYKARDQRLNRIVAIKMLLGGAHSGPMDRVRFQIEAETVASLQHPSIIKIHEIGESNSCPYLVLEFLEGQSLDRQLTQQPLSAREAARVIETLARAMHCAHQRGIVHRDLKPGNVFVLPDGHLRILDFGLAKRLEGDTHTRSGSIMGTPAYMAPEQALGNSRAVGPATDIYALGSILYEMLVGQPPFQGNSVMDTLMQVRSDDPVPPSRLKARLPRDLEVICLKCLRKDPAARYASAEALADDLKRFLAGEPIQARPVPVWERAVKWTRRHPTAAALVGVCTAALLALLGTGVWYNAQLQAKNTQLTQTNKQLKAAQARSRTAVDDMYTQVAEKWLDEEPNQDPLQSDFLKKALRFYEEMSQEEGTDPTLRKATALAYFRVGKIDWVLGRYDDAAIAYDQAIGLQEELVKEFPDPEYRQDLAKSLNDRGELLRTSDRANEAIRWYDRAMDLQRPLVGGSDRPEYRKELARSYYNKGLALRASSPRKALASFDQALTLLEPLTRAFLDDPSYSQELARVYLNQGTLQEEHEAEVSFQKARKLQTALTNRFRRNTSYRYELALTCFNLGTVLRRRNPLPPETTEAFQEARKQLEVLVDAHPDRPIYRYQLAKTWNSLGALLLTNSMNLAEAEEYFKKAAREFEGLAAQSPDATDYHFEAGKVLANLGWQSLRKHQQPQSAQPYLRKAAEHLARAIKGNEANAEYRQALSFVYENLADDLIQLGDHAGAAEAVENMLTYGSSSDRDRYLAARLLARALTCSKNDAVRTADEQLRNERYAARCLQLLQGIDFRKYTPNPSIREEKTFEVLAGRPDFDKLLSNGDKGTPRP
jgi:eukaryotic-like serine/threonine-protein kinase